MVVYGSKQRAHEHIRCNLVPLRGSKLSWHYLMGSGGQDGLRGFAVQLCRPAAPALGVHCSYSPHARSPDIARSDQFGHFQAPTISFPKAVIHSVAELTI